MKTKIKVRSLNVNVYGKTVVLPDIGEVKVSTDGTVEIDEKYAATVELIVSNSPNWEYFEGKIPKAKSVDEEELETEEEGTEETEEEDADLESLETVVRKKLESLTNADLKEVMVQMGASEEDQKKFGKAKALLVGYLIKNVGVEKLNKVL